MKSFKRNIVFDAILREAEAAADVAAKAWLAAAEKRGAGISVHECSLFGGATGPAIGYMLDVCGGGYIAIRDGRKKFTKYLIELKKLEYEQRFGRKPGPGSVGKYWDVRHSLSMRQEMGLHEVSLHAFFDVLKKHGVSDGMYVRTYID